MECIMCIKRSNYNKLFSTIMTILIVIPLLGFLVSRETNQIGKSKAIPLSLEQKRIAKSRIRDLNENSQINFDKNVGDGVFTELYRFNIGEPQDSIFFGDITAVSGTADGHVYILDDKFGRVAIYKRDGTFIQYFGRKGKGPGEMEIPTGIAISNEGNILVSDRMLLRVTEFNKDGGYLKSHKLDFIPYMITTHDSLILISGPRQNKWIHCVNEKMEPYLSFVENDPISPLTQYWHVSFLNNSYFYTVSPMSYEIYKYKLDKGKIKTIKNEFAFVSEIIEKFGKATRYSQNKEYLYFTYGTNVFMTGSFILSQAVNIYPRIEIRGVYYEVFTHLYSLEDEVELHEFDGLPLIEYIDENGLIYCKIEEPEPNIAVYKSDFSRFQKKISLTK